MRSPPPTAVVTVKTNCTGEKLRTIVQDTFGGYMVHERYYDGKAYVIGGSPNVFFAIVPDFDIPYFKPEEHYERVKVISAPPSALTSHLSAVSLISLIIDVSNALKEAFEQRE